MIAEVLLVPLLITEEHTFVDRVQFIARLLRKTVPVAIVGLAGIATWVAPSRVRRGWPIALAAGWFTVQMVALDFDNWPDLFPWFAVVSVGAGLAVGTGRRASSPGAAEVVSTLRRERVGSYVLAAMVLTMALVSVATMGGYGTGNTDLTAPDTYDTDTELEPNFAAKFTAKERQYVYWNRVEIPTCRALGAYTQFRFVKRLGLADGGPWHEAPCGQFEPVWRAVREKYGL